MAQARRSERLQEHPEWGNYILTLKENDKVWGRVDATRSGNVGSATGSNLYLPVKYTDICRALLAVAS